MRESDKNLKKIKTNFGTRNSIKWIPKYFETNGSKSEFIKGRFYIYNLK